VAGSLTAIPMLTRCFERQWAGLDVEKREILVRDRSIVFCRHAASKEVPLWGVEGPSPGRGLMLLSIKMDYTSPEMAISFGV